MLDEALFDALCQGMADAVTDLTEIFEAEHVNTEAWQELELPFGVVLASSGGPGDWGLDNGLIEQEIELLVVREIDGPSIGLRADAKAIIAQFWSTDPDFADPLETADVGQVLETPTFNYGDDLPVNELLRSANREQRVVSVKLRILTE